MDVKSKLMLRLRNNSTLKNLLYFFRGFQMFFVFKPILMLRQFKWFFEKLNELKKFENNPKFTKIAYFPCLSDNISYTPLEPTYFFQDSWAAKHIFNLKPTHHYDVGSSAKTMGILSQFTPVTMIDIRPIELELPNLFFRKGSILALPFEDNSLETISSLCVVEHIGLGRYMGMILIRSVVRKR
ncbi:hypothetical protein [Acinetobacter johnsonii]|uniref:hypothetical protein n=1 Tax=Acinetobacter johnsonii TaxID=40214 RepID=UPI0032B3CF39